MPPQKNCVASVAMIDGTPTYATMMPFTNPMNAPAAIASSTAGQIRP